MNPVGSRNLLRAVAFFAMVALLTTPVFAHTGVSTHGTFFSGLLHPLSGLDHLAAMISVGLWASVVGGKRVWAWPLAFVSAMIAGGILGFSGVYLPAVEPLIAASVIVLGLAVTAVLNAPVWLGAAVVGAMAVFHGHAHGTEAPGGDWLWYALGFVAATAALHMSGIALGQFLQREWPVRLVGGATAALGVLLLLQ